MITARKYTLITGGSCGIGYELAKQFAAHGHNLILVARDKTILDEVAVEINNLYKVHILTISKDLFHYNNARELYDEVKQKEIVVDILVNDAGQGLYGEFKDTDLERELDIIHLNICSLVVLTKLFLKDMLQKGEGRILNVSSIASRLPGPWQSVYHATKAFVQSFTEAIREETKDQGIAITALLPGATNTDFFRKAGMLHSKVVVDKELDDPAVVAEAGYKALMKGDDMVVSGGKNKFQAMMAAITPDAKLAANMYKMQEPVGNDTTK